MAFPILVSVRNTSTRLPGKCLADIAGKPSVEREVERLQRSREADLVAIATSSEPEDDPLAEVARRVGVPCVRGTVDKLPRYLQAAEEFDADFFVVADGDDPLADPEQIDRLFACYRESVLTDVPVDYALVEGVPFGSTGYGVRTAALRRVLELRTDADREVWPPYFTETGMFEVRRLEPDDEQLRRPELRLTLDYAEDLDVLRAIFAHFGDRPFRLHDVVAYLDENPETAAVNRDAQRRYAANMATKLTPVVFRSQERGPDQPRP